MDDENSHPFPITTMKNLLFYSKLNEVQFIVPNVVQLYDADKSLPLNTSNDSPFAQEQAGFRVSRRGI